MINERLDILITQSLSGVISAEDQLELDSILESSSSVNDYYLQALQIWENSQLANFRRIEAVKKEDFQKVLARITTQPKQKKSTSRLSVFTWSRQIAAILTIVVLGTSAYILYWNVPGFGRWTALKASQKIESVELPDGSWVSLNKNSQVVFLNSFTEKSTRQIKLKGEAFFEVTPNVNKPFIVQTQKIIVQVLGTKFNVNENSNKVLVSVSEGHVSMSDKIGHKVMLSKDETGSYQNGNLKKITSNTNFLFWKTGDLTFQNNNLQEVAASLNDYFPEINSVKIETSASAIRITTRFKNAKLNEIFEELSIQFHKKFELKKDGTLIVTDK